MVFDTYRIMAFPRQFPKKNGPLCLIILLHKEWGKKTHVIAENIMCIMFAVGCSAKFSTAYLRMPQLRILLLQIAKDWEKITDKSEREILRKYNEQGRNLVIFYTFYVYMAWLLYTLMPFAPYMLDKFVPLKNGARPILLTFYADYIFFNQVDYHYWTVWHASLVYLHCGFLFSGLDAVYVLTVKHTCGLFAVAGYRFNTSSKFEGINKSMNKINGEIITESLFKNAIVLHNETIRCCSLLEDSFSSSFLVVQSLCVVGIAFLAAYVNKV